LLALLHDGRERGSPHGTDGQGNDHLGPDVRDRSAEAAQVVSENRDVLVVDSPDLIRRQAVPMGPRVGRALAVLAGAPLRYLFGKRDELLGRRWLDGSSEFGEGGGESVGRRSVECDVVVAASQILYEGVPGDDHLGCPIGLKSAHRSQSSFELAVIGFDRLFSYCSTWCQAEGSSSSSTARSSTCCSPPAGTPWPPAAGRCGSCPRLSPVVRSATDAVVSADLRANFVRI
jgi:hypothetical protein